MNRAPDLAPLAGLGMAGVVTTPKRRLHPIRDPLRQGVGPLAHRLDRNADFLRSHRGSAAEEADGFCFVHARLKHASTPKTSMLPNPTDTVAGMGKDSFAQRLRKAMGDTPAKELAAHLANPKTGRLGVTVQAVNQALSGDTKSFSAENTMRAARYLKVDPWWLATGEGAMRAQRPADSSAAELVAQLGARLTETDDEARSVAKAMLLQIIDKPDSIARIAQIIGSAIEGEPAAQPEPLSRKAAAAG